MGKTQHVRKHEVLADPEKGAEDARETKKSKVTLGRHITSDDGFDLAKRRSKFLADTKKANERAHESRAAVFKHNLISRKGARESCRHIPHNSSRRLSITALELRSLKAGDMLAAAVITAIALMM